MLTDLKTLANGNCAETLEVVVADDGATICIHRHNPDDCDDLLVALELTDDGKLRLFGFDPAFEEPVSVRTLCDAKKETK